MADSDRVSLVTTDRRDAVVVVGARGLAIVAGALVTVFTIEIAGAESAGRFFALTSVVYIAAVIGRAGLDRSVVADWAGAESAIDKSAVLRRHWRASILASVTVGLLSSGVAVAASSPPIGGPVIDLAISGALVVGLWAGLEAHRWWVAEANRAMGRLVAASAAGEAVRSATFLAVLLVLGSSTQVPSTTSLVLAGCLGSALPLALGSLPLRSAVALAPRPVPGAVLHQMARSRRYLGGELSEVLSTWSPVAIAALAVPATRVAGFTMALRFVALIGAPLLAMSNYYLPKVAAALAEGRPEQAESAMRNSTIVVFAGSLVIAPAVVGAAYVSASGRPSEQLTVAGAAALLSVGQLASVGYGLCAMTLVAGGHPGIVAANTALAAAIICVGGTLAAIVGGELGLAAVVAGATIVVNRRNSWACASTLRVRTGVLGGLRR